MLWVRFAWFGDSRFLGWEGFALGWLFFWIGCIEVSANAGCSGRLEFSKPGGTR